MNEPRGTPRPPHGLTRLLARAPIGLYRAGLGFLLGARFLLLNHRGRRSGLPRQVVLEVVRHDEDTGDYYICSGFGEASQWYQNLMNDPDTTIELGRHAIPVHARRLDPKEGADEMLRYAIRHPRAARKLVGLMGFPTNGAPSTYRDVGHKLPFICLSPR